ncbi:MAG: hypothetical protein EOO39_15815 [Cytophagaceae bacterium]|nr:MAG: hypothetical protein EOO39_15815 [Cytophagaceae bacterium]
MKPTKTSTLTQEEKQANIDEMVTAWKARKKQIEETSEQEFTSPAYQAALEELDRKRLACGSRTVKV